MISPTERKLADLFEVLASIEHTQLIDKRRSEIQQFWMDRTSWPVTLKQFVFLPQAVLTVGESQSGEDWTSNEPQELPLPMFGEDAGAVYDPNGGAALAYAKSLLARHRPDFRMGLDDIHSTLSAEHWRAVREIWASVEGPRRAASAHRFVNAYNLLRQQAIAGKLNAFTQTIAGGAHYTPLEAIAWTAADADKWWHFGHQGPALGEPGEARRTVAAANLPSFVFFDAAQLAKLAKDLRMEASGAVVARKGAVDRSTKKIVSDELAMKWANDLFVKVEAGEMEVPGRTKFVEMFRKEFPGSGSTQGRAIFDKERPKDGNWRRRAPKGS